MLSQISEQTQISDCIEEMIYVEEHLHKISLHYSKCSFNCLSCSYEASYNELSRCLIVDNDICCPNCKEGKIRLKNKI